MLFRSQAVPGPLFTFAAFLGAAMQAPLTGWLGATVALVAVFLPSFLLVFGALPFWNALRTRETFRAALSGVNAAVVGLLLAALYNPVWTSAITRPADFALALACGALLVVWKVPQWAVVAVGGLGGAGLQLLLR